MIPNKILRQVVRVTFHDEPNPRYYHEYSNGNVGTSNESCATTFALTNTADAIKALHEANSHWGRNASVELVQLDCTERYLQALNDLEYRVNDLREALGFASIEITTKH